ncbi:MAG: DUF4258 domain-containing protein [Minisyncoccia bacterium]
MADYTHHALARLKERKITKKDVATALRHGTQEDTSGGLRKATHRNQRGTLTVIYNIKSAKRIGVITAYWT